MRSRDDQGEINDTYLSAGALLPRFAWAWIEGQMT